MNLNCLRIASLDDPGESGRNDAPDNKKYIFKMSLRNVERSWSGNLAPDFTPKPETNFRRMRSKSNLGTKRAPPSLHWIHTGDSGPDSFDSALDTPRLVRSPGMRRDWSFEDLKRARETS